MSTSSGLGPVVGGRHFRLKRHAADRAGARADLADLRMHRAGVDRAFDNRLRRALAEIFLRIGDEFRAAAGRAEIIGMAAMIGAMLGGVRIDRHAADGIDRAVRCVLVMMARGVLWRHACALPQIPPGGI